MEAKPGLIARMTAWVRKSGGHVLVEVVVNLALPFVIYNYAEAPLGDVRALLASSVPPILWSLVEFARHRRLDALSVLVVSGIALSLLAMSSSPNRICSASLTWANALAASGRNLMFTNSPSRKYGNAMQSASAWSFGINRRSAPMRLR